MQRLVVIGNGMVGHRFCERLVDLGCPEHFAVSVLGEEPRPAYDRVHLSEFFAGRGAEELSLTTRDWYAEHGLDLQLGRAVVAIDRERREVVANGGERFAYDRLVLASGSTPFVPPIPGIGLAGVFLYRTIDDLGAIRAWARDARRAAVIGGGLLGLEAAKAALDLGLEAHVIEFADRLMPRQLDRTGAALLSDAIAALGVRVHLGVATEALVGDERVRALRFSDRPDLPVDLVIVSAGIRPRDDLARAAGLETAPRGGIAVDDTLSTSDPRITAIGECAVHRGVHYGLVAPGYEMADVLARRLAGEDVRFAGADLSAKLKLLGVDVASFGDYFADLERPDATRSLVFEDRTEGVYQKLLFDPKLERLLGGILVGDAGAYLPLVSLAKTGGALPAHPRELLFGKPGEPGGASATALPDAAQICSCNNVSKGDLVGAIAANELTTLAAVKKCTKAATGCGGCQPAVVAILEAELARRGCAVVRHLCEHFPYTRQELFWIVKLGRIESFDALLDSHGKGDGCEVCRPAVASILAATWNDLVFEHATIQDTNDRFLANIQRGGTYSVIPRVPGGEITPDKLIALGVIAKKFDLYCKITGGQRIDLLGARVGELPQIWEDLVAAGFESGHAYGKAMRTVKSCIGSTWCRYGVQDSTALAIRIEERYRGLRAPHKLKSAVSGCIRECAEAQSKDFGVIATEKGWNIYLCGNGGSHPRHADLFATDLAEDEVIRVLDRFLMFYIQTAKPLQRTARWLEELEGGIAKLKQILLEDSLGIGDQLEADMQQLVDTYRCEWRAVVESPELRARFRHFADGTGADDAIAFVRERDQKRPADWAAPDPPAPHGDVPAEDTWTWQKLARAEQFPANGGAAVRYGKVQLAIYNFARRGEWFATQASCPHRKDNVLARGLLGDQAGEPKVACPLHKKTFSLETGKGLSDPNYQVRSFPVERRGEEIWVKLPPAESLERELACATQGEAQGRAKARRMSAAPLLEPDRVPSLVDQLLAEQRALSAVDVFAKRHGDDELPVTARVYEERIPVGRTPLPGQQLAFRVDLDSCTGCKACVTACHSLNGLAPEETWRDVGLLLGTGENAGAQQTVTTACHHCEDPACLAGCPVRAYEKDPVTGIVRHLDDQCIGCQYCVLKCPYEVPKYNAELGIVRKCDMCSSRLAYGEAPACVQGCPNGAISIEIVDAIGAGGARELLLAAAAEIPDSAYTRPTTRYVSRKPIGPFHAANRDRLHPAAAHDPLAVMLVLMQLSVGTVAFAALGAESALARSATLALAAVSALLGLGAATLHLGRPLYAFRAFLGWRTSWMSREILVFGGYVPLVALCAAASALAWLPGVPAPLADLAQTFVPGLLGAALAFGIAGTVCSIMIYVDTRRRAWALSRTAPTFVGTALGLGALGAGAVLTLCAWIERDGGSAHPALWLGIGVLALAVKIAAERRLLSRDAGAADALSRTARLLGGPLRARLRARFAAAAAGLLAATAALACGIAAAPGLAAGFAWAGLACAALGELIERHLYFTSESSPAMPGH